MHMNQPMQGQRMQPMMNAQQMHPQGQQINPPPYGRNNQNNNGGMPMHQGGMQHHQGGYYPQQGQPPQGFQQGQVMGQMPPNGQQQPPRPMGPGGPAPQGGPGGPQGQQMRASAPPARGKSFNDIYIVSLKFKILGWCSMMQITFPKTRAVPALPWIPNSNKFIVV